MTIVIGNEACLIDYAFLNMMFAPVFVSIDQIDDKTMGLRILGGWDLIKRAIGVKLPEVHPNLHTSFKDLYQTMYFKRPIVVFPQCARTNGRGVLDIPPSVVEMLRTAADDGFKIHSVRIDYTFTHFSPYNTTDVPGWYHTLGLLCQFINPIQVQYFFDVQNYTDKDKS